MNSEKLQRAFALFDEYNARDPHVENVHGVEIPKEVLYGQRMTQRLNTYDTQASEALQLAARCQHIGRWEIPRSSYPMDRKGYLKWRSVQKLHQAEVAERILSSCGYESEVIDRVKFLLLKKELQTNTETQCLEDVICLVFIEYYLAEFASTHNDDKVVDILRKTLKKMSGRAIKTAGTIVVTERIMRLIGEAAK